MQNVFSSYRILRTEADQLFLYLCTSYRTGNTYIHERMKFIE